MGCAAEQGGPQHGSIALGQEQLGGLVEWSQAVGSDLDARDQAREPFASAPVVEVARRLLDDVGRSEQADLPDLPELFEPAARSIGRGEEDVGVEKESIHGRDPSSQGRW